MRRGKIWQFDGGRCYVYYCVLYLVCFLYFCIWKFKVALCSSRFKIRKAEHGSATTWSGCSRAKPTAHTGSGIVCKQKKL
jgi:hypothetical protein